MSVSSNTHLIRAAMLCASAAIVATFVTTASAHEDASYEETAALRDIGATAKGAIELRSLAAPGRDTIYSCTHTTMGPALDQPWVDASGTIYFERKPVVEGSVEWPHFFEITQQLESLLLTGNGLPSHPTGLYPIDRTSEAARYDRNPNSISEQQMNYFIPAAPELASAPTCLPMGAIGVALTGGVFFNALDAPARDAVANEVFDLCEGHPQRSGLYHYHHASPCFPQGTENEHSPLVGYALDGFGIYGLRGAGGELLTNADLDECHGHDGEAPGSDQAGYHYHLTEEFPYILGCFMGTVDTRNLRRGPGPQAGGRRSGPIR
jgi:hypothetical protein